MAKGDVAATFTLPKEIDALITKLASKQSNKADKTVYRRDIVIQAVKLLAESK